MTGYFDINHFTLRPILVFSFILTLFGCYAIQLHDLVNRQRVDRSLRLINTHYFIILALNLITVAIKLLENTSSNINFIALLLFSSITLFFISLYLNSTYYSKGFFFTHQDTIIVTISLVLSGLIMLIGQNDWAILLGALIGSLGNFEMLIWKEKKAP